MKSVVALLFVWCGFVLTASESRPSKLEHYQVFGRDYIRLTEWARQSGLDFRWLVRGETATVTNRTMRLSVKADSNKATLNGVNVSLNWPVALKDGVLYLTSQDLQKVIYPVISPTRNSAGEKIRTICIDPGHGGKDPGNLEGREQEKKYTLMLGQELSAQLKKTGFKVVMTRTGDTYPELPARPDRANRAGADLFVSLHFNSSTSRDVRGAEVYCMTPRGAASTMARGEGTLSHSFAGNANDDKNMLLAFQIQKALTRELRVDDRGVQHARWAVLRDARMPAVLIEGGFMSNPSEGRKIYDATYRRQMAQAIVDGIVAYQRLVER
jgi:N-acetylmuramoyl-L-alanine amidase